MALWMERISCHAEKDEHESSESHESTDSEKGRKDEKDEKLLRYGLNGYKRNSRNDVTL